MRYTLVSGSNRPGMDLGQHVRDNFKPDNHWLFQAGEGDVLWVSFNTAGCRPGYFNNFRTLKTLPGKKLFIGDPESHYYQRHIDRIRDLILDVANQGRIGRCIFVGSSMGAYAAMCFGLMGLLPSTAYAFAPQLALRHPSTHATNWITDRSSFDPRYADLRDLVRSGIPASIKALFPCYHYMDGIQITDLLGLPAAGPNVKIVGTSHRVLEDMSAVEGASLVTAYFDAAYRSENLQVPPRFVPSQLDIDLGQRSYQIMEYLEDRGTKPDMSVDDRTSRNHGWFNAKLRFLQREADLPAAIAAGLRSIELQSNSAEYVICLANAYTQGQEPYAPWLAEGLYRQALRMDPRNGDLRRSLADNLRRRGLDVEAAGIEREN